MNDENRENVDIGLQPYQVLLILMPEGLQSFFGILIHCFQLVFANTPFGSQSIIKFSSQDVMDAFAKNIS
jgi:hypothetical protein